VRDINDLCSYPPFILDVYDEDAELFDHTDDYLARAIVEPEDCSIVTQSDFEHDPIKEIPDTPRWHPCRFSTGEPKCGEILVSFAVADIDHSF